ncbi:MAG: putative peptidoglycan glycosyltransferase FtsW [Candidatus Pacebacteria bacterium]|nr:putative peptidoglycan glycosyltransferase FtsW [Candidatus Paceibacterota bacterium]
MKKHRSIILAIATVLLIWGTFTMGTTSFPASLSQYGNVWPVFLHQAIIIGISLALGITAYKIPLKFLQKIAPILFLINVILIFLVFAPGIGIETKGAHRWLKLPGFSFQPSEFLKISFIMYLAAWLSARSQGEKIKNSKRQTKKEAAGLLLPFLTMLGILIAGLIIQPDMTTLAIICAVGALMYFASKAPLWHTITILGLGGTAFLIFAKSEPYRWNRVMNMLNPHADPMGQGFQLKQAAIAIGSGKIMGVGDSFSLGLSRQKFGFLPESITDSIFAVVAEELGFLGALLLIVLFLLFCFSGLKVAKIKGQTFEGFLALGITCWITLQAFANIGGIIGILPLGGIPLPFFSYGGSHIMAEIIGVGLLLNISRKQR